MLFRKDIEPSCLYCKFSRQISETELACEKKGFVEPNGSCRRFRYDPLKPNKNMAKVLEKI